MRIYSRPLPRQSSEAPDYVEHNEVEAMLLELRQEVLDCLK